jgi:hypothetical protein
VRESAPHPGRPNLLALLVAGIVLYVTPFAWIVDRAMRRGTTRMAAVVVVGIPGVVFLATRPPGSFGQAWAVFTMIVSVVALALIGQLILAGVIAPSVDAARASDPRFGLGPWHRSKAQEDAPVGVLRPGDPVQRARRDSNSQPSDP